MSFLEYLQRQLDRRDRPTVSSTVDYGAKRGGRVGLALFLFGVLALMLAAMLLATMR